MLNEKHTALLDKVRQLEKKQLFFIGGAVKSGTTWIERILDAHPEVACKGEAHFMSHLEPMLREAIANYNAVIPKKGNWKKHKQSGLEPTPMPAFSYLDSELNFMQRKMILLMMQKWVTSTSIKCVGEKTPNNVIYFNQLAQLIPEARFIHVIRDIRDIVVSGWFFNINVNPESYGQAYSKISQYAQFMANLWNNEVAKGIRFSREHSEKCLQVRYEDVLSNTDHEVARIYTFVGVDYSKDLLKQCIAATRFESLSGGRGQGVENRSSFYRKGITGDWKNHLDEETLDIIKKQCGPLMTMLGYT